MKYTLKFENYRIEVDTLGAELVTLEKAGTNYLWTKSKPFWQRHAPVLFPIVGKLKENTFLYNGKKYSLPQHGFARDGAFELIEHSEQSLLFRLIENKNPEYPFDFEFYIAYSLSADGLKTTYIIENKGTVAMPFSVGAHPGFLCPMYASEKLEHYYFEFDEDDVLLRTLLQDGLLTDTIREVKLTEKCTPLSEELFKDDALVLSDFKSKSVTLKSPDYLLKVSWNDCTFLGLWKQPNAPFVCIEPWWGVADSIHSNQDILQKKGIQLCAAGEQRTFSFGIEILL